MTGARDWSGKVGDVWAAEWPRTDRSFADLSRHLDRAVLDAAVRIAPGATAIDIGCGAGATSIALAVARPDLSVTGIDLSAELVAVATDRSSGIFNLRFVTADLASGPIDGPPPSLLVSRHGVMFFDDPRSVFAALHRAAAPDAALVFSSSRSAALNPWASELVEEVTGAAVVPVDHYAPGPFGFADATFVADMLASAGWSEVTHQPVDYRYIAGAGGDPVADAVSFLRRIGPIARTLRTAPDADRLAMLDKLTVALQKRCDGQTVAFPAAAWIWRARAGGESS